MKHLAAMLCATFACACLADEFLHSVKIGIEPPDDGQQILNLCFLPAKTVEYDQVVFECVYRQQIPWQDERGKRVTKTIEPVFFTYRRPSVRMVADLDCNISFRVPVSLQRLIENYGEHSFATNAPVAIDRLRIAGERGQARLWEQELKVPGKYVIQAKPPPPLSPPLSPRSNKFGEVNLD
jgi:hypothetical protein